MRKGRKISKTLEIDERQLKINRESNCDGYHVMTTNMIIWHMLAAHNNADRGTKKTEM